MPNTSPADHAKLLQLLGQMQDQKQMGQVTGAGNGHGGDEMEALCSHLNIASTSNNNSVFNAATSSAAAAGNMMHPVND